MLEKSLLAVLAAAGVFLAGFANTANAAQTRVYELRTYTAVDGKLDDLLARFRNHTVKLFEKHGMKNIGYWIPQDEPLKKNTLIYVVSHESREQAKKNWDAFRADPVWQKARDASEAKGKIVEKVESIFMNPADFSQLK